MHFIFRNNSKSMSVYYCAKLELHCPHFLTPLELKKTTNILTSEKLKNNGIDPARNDPINITTVNAKSINVSSIFAGPKFGNFADYLAILDCELLPIG